MIWNLRKRLGDVGNGKGPLRFRIFRALLSPVSEWFRVRRMRLFCKVIKPRPGDRVLDLGGQPGIWAHVSTPLRITLLNLPGVADPLPSSHHTFSRIEGDACDLKGVPPSSFDIVYSNSVIEHVGGDARQQAFADQVQALQTRYWIQTPSKWFPVEAHTGMPFWWFYPLWLRKRILAGWRKRLPAWAEMVEGTTVIERSELQRLFPKAQIQTERFLGFSKSYVAWCNSL